MINIKEGICNKLPGITSLFISFEYNVDIINVIQETCRYRVWDKKTSLWEVPATYLSSLISELQYIDDINLNLLKDVKKETFLPTCNYKVKPYDYQLEGIKYGINHDKWLLLDEMGLGKSLQIIYIAEELYKRKEIKHCLIVCGINSLKTNWEKEIKKFSNLSCIVIGKKVSKNGNTVYTSIKDRVDQIANGIEEFFIIINIESLRSSDIVTALKLNDIDMIAVDEIQKAKSKTSQQGKNLLKLQSKYMIAATGTLIMNNPLDAYVPLTWIGANKSNLTNFKNYYCNFGGFNNTQIIGYKNMSILKEQIDQYSLRRTKDLLNLPPKTIIHEVLAMNDDQCKFYNDIKDGVATELKENVNIQTNNLLALTIRLRQASSCPSILTTDNVSSSKINRAIDLTNEIIANGDKVIIFSTFKEPVNILYNELHEHNPVIGTGDITDSEFSNNVDRFQRDDNCKVFLGTISKAGTGITLTAATYVIFIDCDWVPSNNRQAEDRAYRIGTTKPVFIYYLWNDGTIDTRIKNIVEDKSQIADYIVDDKLHENLSETLLNLLKS